MRLPVLKALLGIPLLWLCACASALPYQRGSGTETVKAKWWRAEGFEIHSNFERVSVRVSVQSSSGNLDVFVVDEAEFELYKTARREGDTAKPSKCYAGKSGGASFEGTVTVRPGQPCWIIISNRQSQPIEYDYSYAMVWP
jgi:hypothetical protein